MQTDVLIVGAGPTGLMLANQLARRGIKVVIIDRNPAPSVHSKALGVQARTLEIYAGLGIAAEALKLGRIATGASMWVNGQRAAHIPVGEIGTGLSPYPYMLILGQDDNERLLGQALREQGVEVRWNTSLIDLAQSSTGVSATLAIEDAVPSALLPESLESPESSESPPAMPPQTPIEAPASTASTQTLAVSWVAGCDGAHSSVRKLCDIAFSGAAYEHVFYVADTIASGSMTPGELNVYLWRGGFHLFFPMRGEDHWRVVGIVPPALRGRDDLTFADIAPFVLAEVGTAARHAAPAGRPASDTTHAGAAPGSAPLTFGACRWFSTYHVHHRRADRFRQGRCFLLGDAAHVHSPVGAQGMNTGLQDAYNLAWKLALVASGQARETLLDSYPAERIPVADHLLESTDKAFTFLISQRWLAGIFRLQIFQRVLALAMHSERTRKQLFQTLSQIGIRYRASPLSRTLAAGADGAPRAGDRFPWLHLRFSPDGPVEDLFEKLDDRRFNLLLFGQALPDRTDWADMEQLDGLLAFHVIPADPVNEQARVSARIGKPAFYLLRPDGHVGLAGAQLDPETLTHYLAHDIELVGIHAPT